MRIRRRVITAGGATIAAGALGLSQVGPSVAQGTERPVRGEFSLIQMVHTGESPSNFATGATIPWNGARTQGGRYVYRGIPCTGPAPVNNIASDLPTYGARVEGSRAPSSTRAHPFRIRLRKARRGGWEMVGRIILTVCKLSGGPTAAPDPVPDADKPKIDVRFIARFRRVNAENLRWTGTFTLKGGTGRYEDLEGSGRIAGYFFCFDPRGCANTGALYRDGQFVMHGTYRDPTPQLGG